MKKMTSQDIATWVLDSISDHLKKNERLSINNCAWFDDLKSDVKFSDTDFSPLENKSTVQEAVELINNTLSNSGEYVSGRVKAQWQGAGIDIIEEIRLVS